MVNRKSFAIYSLCFLLLPLLVFFIVNINNFDFRSQAGSATRLADNVAKADLNFDNKISISDYTIWVSYYTKYAKDKSLYNEIADINKDKSISIKDYTEWINSYREFLSGKGLISVDVELSIETSTILVGESTTATAKIIIEDGNIEDIKGWELEDTSVAKLSGDSNSTIQTITGIKKGITSITVITSSGATASLPITITDPGAIRTPVNPEPANISINLPNGENAYVDDYIALEVILSGGINDSIRSFESSNPNVIDTPTTLESNQKLLAKRPGIAKITVKTINGAEKTVTLTVIEKSKAAISIKVNKNTVYEGETIDLEVTLTGGTNDSISKWESSNPDVINIPTTLDSKQTLEAKKEGTTEFTIYTKNGGEKSITLTVEKKIEPATISVKFKNNKTTVYIDETIEFEVTLTGGTNDSISKWESSNPEVIGIPATLDGKQTLKAKSEGRTNFTIYTANGGKYTEVLTVMEKPAPTPASISVKFDKKEAYEGEFISFEVTLKGGTDDSISDWEVSDSKIIKVPTTISSKGSLEALKKGTTVFTIYTANGGKFTETLTVKEREKATLSISPEKNEINAGSYTRVKVTMTGDSSDKIDTFEATTDGGCTIETQTTEKKDDSLTVVVNGTCTGTITIKVKTKNNVTAQAYISVLQPANTKQITYHNYNMYIPQNWQSKEAAIGSYYYGLEFTLPTGTVVKSRIISIENLEDIKNNSSKIANLLSTGKLGSLDSSFGTGQITGQGVKTHTDGSEYYYFDSRRMQSSVKYLYIPTPDGILFEVAIKSNSANSEVDSILDVFRTATVSKSIEESTTTRTIMIYMAGSNLETDNCIATYALNAILPSDVDYTKTKILVYTASTDSWCNSIIQSTENAIYELTETGLKKLKKYSKSPVGTTDNFQTFLDYAYENYKADKYMLLMYNHGAGAYGLMVDSGTNDLLSANEMADGLKNSKLIKDNKKFETIVFHTCLNSNIELLSYIYPYTDYIIASEEISWGAPGTSEFEIINKIENLSPIDYGKKYIDLYKSMVEAYNREYPIANDLTYALLDASKIEAIVEDTNDFFTDVNSSYTANRSTISNLRRSTYEYGKLEGQSGSYYHVDLKNITSGMSNISSTKANKLINDIQSAVLYNLSTKKYSNGLSIYFPTIQAEFQYTESNYNYSGLYSKSFSQYVDFIKKYLASGYSSYSVPTFTASTINSTNNSITLNLSEEQLNSFINAEVVFYKKMADGTYKKVLQSDNVELINNTLVSPFSDIGLIKHKNSTDEYIFTKYIKDCDLYIGYGTINNKDMTSSLDIEYYLTNQMYPKLSGGYVLSGNNIQANPKIPVKLTSWYTIATQTPIYDSQLNDTNINANQTIKTNDVNLERKELSTIKDAGDIYYSFLIQDTYGNTINTDLEILK